jgi:putative mycofactocin binding protein MftB
MPATTQTRLGERALTVHPQVALRAEPFGALAYHYGNRRLVFLKHPGLVALVRSLDAHPTLDGALDALDVPVRQRPVFERAIASLIESEMVHDRPR